MHSRKPWMANAQATAARLSRDRPMPRPSRAPRASSPVTTLAINVSDLHQANLPLKPGSRTTSTNMFYLGLPSLPGMEGMPM
jgi:hypothetical protein